MLTGVRDRRPGPEARVVGRPRGVGIAGWSALLAIGVFGLVGRTGAVAAVVGALFALVEGFGRQLRLRDADGTRVELDGTIWQGRQLLYASRRWSTSKTKMVCCSSSMR